MAKSTAWQSMLTPVERKLLRGWDEEIAQLRDKLTIVQASKRRLVNTAAVRAIRASK